LAQGLLAVQSLEKDQVLVAASDQRPAKIGSSNEMVFGDGAAAVLLGNGPVIAEFKGAYTLTLDFVDHYRGRDKKYDYLWEERWVREEGYAKILTQAFAGLYKKLSLAPSQVAKVIFPCPYPAEHRRIGKVLGFAPEQVVDNLYQFVGETGAAHPLLMLVKALEEAAPGERILMAGYGQGSDVLCFEVTEAIRDLSPRKGFQGSLKNRLAVEHYLKFLKFRDQIDTEMGIRAEAPTQTAMTVLWRKRDMILGLVGGRCTVCGTPQFPRMEICVNPECLAVKTQEPYEFADRPARIMSFTGDYLAVSVNPPGIYGMIEFEGGGRFMADFTDCELSKIQVGQPVAMSFRRRYQDKERGFSGYFWKAVPLEGA
jgi:3-hydroxy-3-methylglutaryl CoA synthase